MIKTNIEKTIAPVIGTYTVLMIIAMFLTTPYRLIDLDAGYYLGALGGMTHGLKPYTDIHFGHTPLYMLVLYPLRCLVEDTHLFCTLSAMVSELLLIATTALVADIIWQMTRHKIFTYGSLLYLPMVYLLGGGNAQLEPYYVFFGVAAIDLILRHERHIGYVILSGICLGCAFLSKQYGLLFSPAVGIYLLVCPGEWRKKIGEAATLVLSFFIPVALAIAVLVAWGIPLDRLYSELFLNGYSATTEHAYIKGWGMFILRLAFFPLLAFYAGIRHGKRYPALTAMAFTGILFGSMQFTFRAYDHYFIPMVPFLWILLAMEMEYVWNRSRTHRIVAAVITLLGVLTFIIHFSIYSVVHIRRLPHQFYEHMEANLRPIDFDRVRKTYVWGTPGELYLVDKRIIPTMTEICGYSIENTTDSIFLLRLEDADCFIGGTKEFTPFLAEKDEIRAYMQQHYDELPSHGDVRVFIKKDNTPD